MKRQHNIYSHIFLGRFRLSINAKTNKRRIWSFFTANKFFTNDSWRDLQVSKIPKFKLTDFTGHLSQRVRQLWGPKHRQDRQQERRREDGDGTKVHSGDWRPAEISGHSGRPWIRNHFRRYFQPTKAAGKNSADRSKLHLAGVCRIFTRTGNMRHFSSLIFSSNNNLNLMILNEQ